MKKIDFSDKISIKSDLGKYIDVREIQPKENEDVIILVKSEKLGDIHLLATYKGGQFMSGNKIIPNVIHWVPVND